ncbi:hypothetical protein ABPG74_005316 [Tetrahymena malaccensis]
MQKKNNILRSFCLAFVLINLTLSQSLTVPLNFKQNGSLYFTLKYNSYGFKECQVNLIPSIYYCSNVITQTAQEAKECGSIDLGYNAQIQGEDYISNFQIGDQQVPLIYTSPNQQSHFYGQNELCFSLQDDRSQANALDYLYQKKFIAEKQVFFSLNSQHSLSQPLPAGKMDIGAADISLINQDSDLVYLKSFGLQNSFSTPINRDLKFGNILLSNNPQLAQFDIESRFHVLSIYTFPSLLQAFDSQGIEYCSENENIFLPSIEKLKDITLSLISEDNSPFVVRLNPQQYTQQLSNGQYQLLFKQQIHNAAFIFGNTIFESYYVGFNKDKKQVLIAKKSQQNSSQF